MTWFRCQNGNGGGGSGGNYTDTAWNGSLIPNTRIDTLTGLEVSTTGYGATDFIDLGASTTLYRCGDIANAGYNAFYDSNKTYITGFYGGTDTTIPSNAKYARLSDVSPMDGKIFTRAEGGGGGDDRNAQQLLIQSELIPNSYINSSGQLVEYAGWSATDWIDIHEFTTLYVNAITCDYTCWYDSNKNKVSGTPLRAGVNSTNGCYYIRFSNNTTDMTNSNFKVFGEYTS